MKNEVVVLRRAIRAHVGAQVSKSWRGYFSPDQWEAIDSRAERSLARLEKALAAADARFAELEERVAELEAQVTDLNGDRE